MMNHFPRRSGGSVVGWLWKHARGSLLIAMILAVFVSGLWVGGRGKSAPPREPREDVAGAEAPSFWTCSMHPQIRQPGPGRCPLCDMALIPVTAGAGDALGPRELRVSDHAAALMNIQVTPVRRQFVDARLRLVGKVAYDETRLAEITAWVGGRLDRLYVDYTGTTVRSGDHLAEIYSPDLLVGQRELIEAARTARSLPDSAGQVVRQNAELLLVAAREKLRLLGLASEQIEAIEERGQPADHVTLHAPVGGIVIDKPVKEGMYVETGTRIYTIADLSKVWVMLEAYEADLPWLHYGQDVEFTAQSHPGRTFHGRIAFIDPVLDDARRIVRLRVNVENVEGLLKPGMFVSAVVHARVARGGKVMSPDLAGKWISPMHPEIVKDSAGSCDICGMALVRAEELGYVSAQAVEEAPLVVPASAALVTGVRAVVYVKKQGEDGATYEGREIVLGPRAGDYYLVESGLEEGELVVTRGAFMLDAELQIQARPSMMSPEGGGAPGHQHGAAASRREVHPAPPEAFADQLAGMFQDYLAMSRALAGDDPAGAKGGGAALARKLHAADAASLDGAARGDWNELAIRLHDGAEGVAGAEELDAMRVSFGSLSAAMLETIARFPGRSLGPVHHLHCPMAFDDRGADWLSSDKAIANPYFGAEMLRCGEVKGTVIAAEGSP